MKYFDLANCKYDFASDNINIIKLVYDSSGSMEGYQSDMIKANKAFYSDFSKFEERGSVAISKTVFATDVQSSAFEAVKDFNTNYTAYGYTALYDGIVTSVNETIEYYNEIVKRLNVRPKITYLVFSDGDNNCGEASKRQAMDKIRALNSLESTTVFVAFGEAISLGTGEDLGFTCTRDITSVKELISCMGNELSRSCKEQSRSAVALKSSFFSKADKNQQEDNVKEEQIFEDTFFNL